MESLPDRIAKLEEQVLADPDSRDLREELMSEYVGARLLDSPRRYEHILWYVRHHPRHNFARCPLAHIHREEAPEAYDAVERAWRSHLDDKPNDGLIVRGLAAFIVAAEWQQALAMLEGFLQTNPSDSEAWLDLGRMQRDPAKQLTHFQEARARGSVHPNLAVWIARSAIRADDRTTAERAGHELLDRAAGLRSRYGDQMDWLEHGRELWAKARAVTSRDGEARGLVHAIAEHAFHKHWGHTALGIVAVRSGQIDAAAAHLHESAAMPGDYRVSSYGPSFDLADELCTHRRWSDVAKYLEACAAFWDSELLQALRAEVELGRHPEFPGT